MITLPKKGEKDTTITDDKSHRIMYFSKDITEYTLDFKENTLDRMIHLSKAKTGSEIIIKNFQTGKEVTLKANNAYYSFENTNSIFNGKLSLKVSKGNDAMIEFLFAPINYEIIKDKEITTPKKLTKPVIINFEQNTKDVNINITLTSKNNFAYSYIKFYSKNNYIPYTSNEIQPSISGSNTYTLNIPNLNETLEKDESFSLLLYIDNKVLTSNEILLTKIEAGKIEPTDKNDKEDSGLPGWAIALIVLGSIIVAVTIAIIVWKCVVSKDRVNSELIGSLTNESKGKENELDEDR